jgi:hypothetical protein
MDSNSVYNKLLELKGKEISLSEFQDLLESSNRRNTIFVQWETNEGNIDYYEMYWDANKYVGGEAGGSETKQEEGMFNIQCKDVKGKWRTLNLQTVIKCRFENKLYKIK